MRVLLCSQHYKSMGKVSGAQEQVTPKRIVRSGLKSHLCKRFYACPRYLQVWRRSNQNWRCYCVYNMFFGTQGQVTQKPIDGCGRNLARNWSRLRFYACPVVTCKFDEDQIENEGDSMQTWFFPLYLSQWELSVAMATSKFGEDPIKNEQTPFSQYKSMENCFSH